MEKQSLIKYYCALFLVLVVLTGSNNAVAQPSSPTSIPTAKPTITPPPAMTQSSEQPKAESNNNMLFPLLLSIIALAASGGAIALTIFKNKKINDRISSDDEKHTRKIKSLETDNIKPLEKKYNDLLTSQLNSQAKQPLEAISPASTAHNQTNVYLESAHNQTNVYLESDIQRLSERINELENKLKATTSSNQSHNLEPDFNLLSQSANSSQSDITQPLENIDYIKLVNIYRDNAKLLEQKAIKVSEDKDSIARRHTDSSQKIVLKQTNNGNYWIIHDDVGINCWLLPKINLRINQYSYETTKALFECYGYQLEHYNKFKLIKPAKVILLSSDEQTWQINELGILEFTVED